MTDIDLTIQETGNDIVFSITENITSGNNNIDGGVANSIYLTTQKINGGNA